MQILSLSKVSNDSSNEEGISVTIRDDNGITKYVSIFSSSPNWNRASEAMDSFVAGNTTVEELAKIVLDATDTASTVREKLTTIKGLDSRLAINGNQIVFDGDPIDPVLEDRIFSMLNEDGSPRDELNWRSFSKFVDNLYKNVSEDVRSQLFGWLAYEEDQGNGFALTPDGCFIGFKGCAGTVEEPVSINHGTAYVNDERYDGAIPNKVGSVVSMPRSRVQADPAVGCSTGLHVGTYDYASNWAHGVLLTVKVDPRDVVSVPTECAAQKIRTCRYEIVGVAEGPNNTLTWGDDNWGDSEDDHYDGWEDEDEPEYGYCDNCGDEVDIDELDVHDGLCADCEAEDEVDCDCADCSGYYDDEDEADDESDNSSRVVSFTYNGKDREVYVENENDFYIDGYENGQYKTFSKNRVFNYHVVSDGSSNETPRRPKSDFEVWREQFRGN